MERRVVRVYAGRETVFPTEGIIVNATCGNQLNEDVHEVYDFLVYQHEGDTSEPRDRWYRLSDLDVYFNNAMGSPTPMVVRQRAEPWHNLVRRYNTMLQGLAYRVRDQNVDANTLFVNAEVLRQHTGKLFV